MYELWGCGNKNTLSRINETKIPQNEIVIRQFVILYFLRRASLNFKRRLNTNLIAIQTALETFHAKSWTERR